MYVVDLDLLYFRVDGPGGQAIAALVEINPNLKTLNVSSCQMNAPAGHFWFFFVHNIIWLPLQPLQSFKLALTILEFAIWLWILVVMNWVFQVSSLFHISSKVPYFHWLVDTDFISQRSFKYCSIDCQLQQHRRFNSLWMWIQEGRVNSYHSTLKPFSLYSLLVCFVLLMKRQDDEIGRCSWTESKPQAARPFLQSAQWNCSQNAESHLFSLPSKESLCL